jgi:hypothetical protein
LTAIFYPTTFGVMNRLMKTALICLFVNLGASNLIPALNNVDGRFFSALELT